MYYLWLGLGFHGSFKLRLVILYHEVMWYLMDNLIQDKVLHIPAVYKDPVQNKQRLNEVVFFIEGGLMQ